MDSRRLPGRALVDTGLVIRALGDLAHDAATPVCKEFYGAMLDGGNEMLIAAPTIAEIMRKDGKRSVPRVRGIEVVAFDDVAARILGGSFPADVLKQLAVTIGGTTTQTYLKYDALIVACAVRHNAECIVALDGDIHKLGAIVGIDVRPPTHFLAPQAELPLAGAPSGDDEIPF